MFSKLSIRQRLLIFGGVWLTVCTFLLTFYLVSQAKRALFENTIQRGQMAAERLSEEASLHLHAGNHQAVEELLEDTTRQEEILHATIEFDQLVFGKKVTVQEALISPKGMLLGEARYVRINGIRALSSEAKIGSPAQTHVLSDELLHLKKGVGHDQKNKVRIFLSVEPIFERMESLVRNVVIFFGIVLGFGFVLGWAVSAPVMFPLRRLARQAKDFTISEVEPLELNGSRQFDEIGLIWNSLSDMKHSLDCKTAEISQLKLGLENKVLKRTAILEQINDRLSEILRLKNDLILQLSHEVKTPLTALSGLVSNLRDGLVGPLSNRQRDYLERMDAVADHLKRLLSALLHFAISETRRLPLTCHAISIEEVTQKVLFAIEPIQREKGVACVIGDNLKSLFVFADQDRVEQILLNLIHNAIKASPEGSSVTINAQERENEVVISVRDTGLGMGSNLRGNVFQEPSFSDGKKGNGVGLYICRYLVELHGGNIWFHTIEGKGSTFFFTLPKALSLVGAEHEG